MSAVVTKYRNSTRFETEAAAVADFTSALNSSLPPTKLSVMNALVANGNLNRTFQFDVGTQTLTETSEFIPAGVGALAAATDAIGLPTVGAWIKGE